MVREHMDRYRFALKFTEPTSKVVDCACGTGYGAELLSRSAEDVSAFDASEEAIRFCRSRYASSGVRFEVSKAEALPLEPASVDVYTCFETIEHVENPEQVLKEAKRVVKPGGYFLVSTPNRVFSGLGPGEKPTNPFHVREWSLKEFHGLLQNYFPNLRHYVQRVKSNNKFHSKYLASKAKRLIGLPDVVAVKTDPMVLEQLEAGTLWNPMILISVCRN
jgi:ubiquinone/menaquinone biosynthesis C-methylase UbiE